MEFCKNDFLAHDDVELMVLNRKYALQGAMLMWHYPSL